MPTSEPDKPSAGAYEPAGQAESYWLKDKILSAFGQLREPLTKEVIVLGAGIAGVTTAFLLQRAGLSTAIFEARNILGGVTGHTTAKITPAHGKYKDILTNFGEEGARQYAAANQTGFDTIASLVAEYNIACDYLRRDFYLYEEKSEKIDELKKEGEAAAKAGLDSSFTLEVPLPFPAAGGFLYPAQAQFHPQKYLSRLLEEYIKNGGEIFEGTPAQEISEKATGCRVKTSQSEARASYLVVASHFPFMLNDLYYAWMEARRSYVLALQSREPGPEGMFFQMGPPYYAIRFQPNQKGNLLLISGGDHRAGQGGDTRKYYQQLEELARKYFNLDSAAYHWSTQDNFTADLLPFMGPLTSGLKRTFVATGFGGWGMTNGTASALVIRDLIQGKPHPWPILSPRRCLPWRNYINFARINWETAKSLVTGHVTSFRKKKVTEIAQGEGRVSRLGHHRLGISRDEKGNLKGVRPVCTHMGCVVHWNRAEQSWDCPCHGSRFSRTGETLHGPAISPLTPENKNMPPE